MLLRKKYSKFFRFRTQKEPKHGLLLVSVSTSATNIGLFLGRCRPMTARHVAFLLGLCPDFTRGILSWSLTCTAERDATEDDLIDVVATIMRDTLRSLCKGGSRFFLRF